MIRKENKGNEPKPIRMTEKEVLAAVDEFNTANMHFPDAEYYTGGGGFNLLLGSSHDENCRPQQQVVAVSGNPRLFVNDGDW